MGLLFKLKAAARTFVFLNSNFPWVGFIQTTSRKWERKQKWQSAEIILTFLENFNIYYIKHIEGI